MGRPCTKCPSMTVQSCCGLRNLRVASLLIGFLKVMFFTASIIATITILGGTKTGNENADSLPTGSLVLGMLTSIGFVFLSVVLIAGIFKKRRNYVMIYWVVNMVWTVLTLIGLFTTSLGVGTWIITFCYTVMEIYFQIVIRSYYLEMNGAVAGQPAAAQNPANSASPTARY